MDASLEKKVIECLDALEQGEPIDQILARYPETADRLRPILLTAVRLSQLRLQPSLAAQAKSREAFLAQADEQPQSTPGPTVFWRWRQRLVPLLSLTVVLLLLGVGIVALSASAVPGDPLYGSKRLVEEIRLSLTTDFGTRMMLAEQFQQERIREVETLLRTGRGASVEFEGIIESVEDNTWVIAGLSTRVNEDTQIEGTPAIGREARVIGRTGEGVVIATAVTITGSGQPLPTPTAKPEATTVVRPTATPTMRQTATASITPTQEPADIVPATVTATSQVPATSTAELTATPTNSPPPPPPSDDNDNGQDDGHENDNENDNNGDDEDDGDDGNEHDEDNHNDNGDGNDNDNDNDNENDNDNDDDDNNGNENDDDDDSNDNSNDDEEDDVEESNENG